MKRVAMRHPDFPDAPIAYANEEAFDKVWVGKGFVKVEPTEAKASAILNKPVDKLDTLNKSDLERVANHVGVETNEKTTKADLAAAITENVEGEVNG